MDTDTTPTTARSDVEALTEMEARKDAAYLERNQVVAALAKAFPSGVSRTAIEGWSEDWHGCVYIDLPTGQTSWHFHDSQAYLFDGLPPYAGTWDGHDTPEKYHRLAALAQASVVQAGDAEPEEPMYLVMAAVPAQQASRDFPIERFPELYIGSARVEAEAVKVEEMTDALDDLVLELRSLAHCAPSQAEQRATRCKYWIENLRALATPTPQAVDPRVEAVPVDEAVDRERFEAWQSRMGISESDLADKCSEGAPCAGEYRSLRLQDDWDVWLAAKQDAATLGAKGKAK